MGRHVLRRPILGYSVCLCPAKGTPGLNELKFMYNAYILTFNEIQLSCMQDILTFNEIQLSCMQDILTFNEIQLSCMQDPINSAKNT